MEVLIQNFSYITLPMLVMWGIGGVLIYLAIVKEMVERNRGSISVTSEIGKGSTFRVELPLTPPRHHHIEQQITPGKEEHHD